MAAAVPPRVRAALGALAVLLSGCEGCREPGAPVPAPPPGGPESEAPRPSSRRVGVKVPMASGWSAQVEPDGSFQFGPQGRPVLRVELRSGQGASLPNAETLARQVAASFARFERSDEQREEGEDVSLVRLTLSPRGTDGGVEEAYPALFGARRVGKDLFLCSTLPGVGAEQVDQAAEACRGIEFQAPR